MTIDAGTKLGRYEIRSKIGEGGMGEVYLAQDTKLDRKVALKILPVEVAANKDRMRRFVQEAKAASALNHPNIITIHEIDEDNSTHFIATEFIDGETLRQQLNVRRTRIAEALDLSVQIASALSAAHAAGIIHRDIKPENIMLRRDGIVKVVDFGLAKLSEKADTGTVDGEAVTKALLQTEPGLVMGTAAYMSPEQARGLVVDARTDIFSLGVVIYEMVAGQAPFGGATRSDLIVALLERDPPPLARFTPEAPAELERLVMKALAKDRDDRYQTAKDLLIDLKRLKQKLDVEAEIERTAAPEKTDEVTANKAPGTIANTAESVNTQAGTARPTSSAEYLLGEVRTHKLAAIAALLVLTVGVAALYFFTRGNVSIRPTDNETIDSIAVLPFANESGNPDVEYLSDGMADSLINSLSQLPHLSVKARTSVFRYKGKQADPQQVASDLSVQAILTGRVVQRGDDLTLYLSLVNGRNGNQVWGEQYNRKLTDLLALQSEIARDVSQKLRARLSGADEQKLAKNYTANAEAYQLYLRGRHSLNQYTEEGLKRSIEYFNQATQIDPGYALAYSGVADANHWLSSMYLRPIDASPKAKAAAARALVLDPNLAEAHVSLALVLSMYEWDWAAAEPEFKRAIELNPNYATAHHWYGRYLALNKRPAESIAEMERARALDPLSPLILTDNAWAHFFERDYDKAIEHFNKALELDKDFMVAYWVRGWAYQEKGNLSAAIADYEKAQSLEDGATIKSFLANAYAVAGKRNEAQQILNGLLALRRQRYVSGASIASIYSGLGNQEQAFMWLERAFEEHDEWMVWLKYDYRFGSLRSDSRFADLVRRVGLPP